MTPKRAPIQLDLPLYEQTTTQILARTKLNDLNHALQSAYVCMSDLDALGFNVCVTWVDDRRGIMEWNGTMKSAADWIMNNTNFPNRSYTFWNTPKPSRP